MSAWVETTSVVVAFDHKTASMRERIQVRRLLALDASPVSDAARLLKRAAEGLTAPVLTISVVQCCDLCAPEVETAIVGFRPEKDTS